MNPKLTTLVFAAGSATVVYCLGEARADSSTRYSVTVKATGRRLGTLLRSGLTQLSREPPRRRTSNSAAGVQPAGDQRALRDKAQRPSRSAVRGLNVTPARERANPTNVVADLFSDWPVPSRRRAQLRALWTQPHAGPGGRSRRPAVSSLIASARERLRNRITAVVAAARQTALLLLMPAALASLIAAQVCTLGTVNALIAAAIGLLGAAIGAALAATVAPWPFDIGLLLAAAGLTLATNAVLGGLNGAINAYRACRDRAEGPSDCSLSNVFQTAVQVTTFVGPAAFLAAALLFAFPFIGKALGVAPSSPLWAGVLNCGIAIALLLGLLTAVHFYAACRDRSLIASPTAA